MRDSASTAIVGSFVAVVLAAGCGHGRFEPTPVQQEIDNRNAARLKDLLDDGADPDDDSYLSSRPMWSAVEMADPRFAKLLIEYGADATYVRDYNWTYAHSAARWGGAADIVDALVEAGADPCARVDQASPIRSLDEMLPNARGMTALDIAKAVDNTEMIPVLEEASTAC